ncbi:MAG: response regulator [Sulfuricella sp.]|nr:response regulator [Sulfuricella sp.]
MSRTLSKQELAPLLTLSLLFVDDDEGIRAGMSRSLKRRFLAYYDAPDGQEGLALYRQYRPDIIVTDVTMPVMDGLEMSRKIREENPEVPIIVNSAHNEMDFFVEAISIGIDSYILKPTDISALLFLVLKCAQPILKQRALETQNKLIQHLLDLSTSPTLIASGGKPECANQALLDFLGYSSAAELYAQFEQSGEDALTNSAIKQAEELDRLAQVRNDPDVLRRLLQNSKKKVDSFELARFDMPEIDKYVFSLKPTIN